MPERASLIALILDRPMCLPCTALKAGMSLERATKALDTIATALAVRRETGRCAACGTTTTVHLLWPR
jgi:hypothetical protein